MYTLLFLAIVGLVGWITYEDYQNPISEQKIEAQSEITPVTIVPTDEKTEDGATSTQSETALELSTEPEDKKPESEEVSSTESEIQTEAQEELNQSVIDQSTSTETTEISALEPETTAKELQESKTNIATEPKADGLKKEVGTPAEPEVKNETNSVTPSSPSPAPEPSVSDTNVAENVNTDQDPPISIENTTEEKIALAPVPDPEISKNSDFGLLPIIGPGGKMPWRTYGRPFDDPLSRPRIAIVISEMGMSSSATKTAIQKLPGAVTLSFNPYARGLQDWIEQARAAGHEVLLQLPMEPFGYPNNDPGPHSLLTSLTDRENLNRLDWMLGRFTGYSGVTNQMGSRFTSSLQDMEPIMKVLKERGLLFLDGRTSSKSIAAKVASQLQMPFAVNNRFLDHKADRDTIDKRLSELERIAKFTGTAVGVGYPYPVTMERISVWAQTLNRKGLVLAPVSAVVNRQEIR
ncbi:divergent polysaccharide deacetylase family protein [Sneathiella glossodoripedis]|uniref:divergent polysaccharide deacetylase family protein n=1 Tax=Sneathiella glossodoripedis TaxID=418853 RepID=UPI00131F3770|nr:divergent polysaccharide deacetylase family protein [Sneathiella glossodoripedis]